MKSIVLLPLLALMTMASLPADPVLRPDDVLVICGDSITESRGYSAPVEEYLLESLGIKGLRVVESGQSGERVPGFSNRVKNSVLIFHPTVVTICYGMNDGSYSPMSDDTGKTYRDSLTKAVDQLKAGGVRTIIVMSPGAVDVGHFNKPNATADVYNQTLGALGGIAKEVAAKEGVQFADMHAAMVDAMAASKAKYGKDYVFIGGDGVHPGSNSYLVMQDVVLKALGCDGAIGTITVDLAAHTAEGTPGQKILSVQDGAVNVESSRYPYCLHGDVQHPEMPTNYSMSQVIPFNDDLNRYLLVVKNLKTAKAKVTWGTESQEFSAADLAKGVNLVAAFLDNPFVAQFDKVDSMVQQQQAYEGDYLRNFLSNLNYLKSQVPAQGDAIDKLAVDSLPQAAQFQALAVNRIIPIQHTIKIEPIP